MAADVDDGTRIGRFLVIRDVDGKRHALSASAVSAICETDDGSMLMLPGGKLVHVPLPLLDLVARLDGR